MRRVKRFGNAFFMEIVLLAWCARFGTLSGIGHGIRRCKRRIRDGGLDDGLVTGCASLISYNLEFFVPVHDQLTIHGGSSGVSTLRRRAHSSSCSWSWTRCRTSGRG